MTPVDPSSDPTSDVAQNRFLEVIGDGITIELDLSPIDHLLEAAAEGFRLYELFRLPGPDELLAYTDVRAYCEGERRPDWWQDTWRDEKGQLTIVGHGELSPWVGGGEHHDRYRIAWERSGRRWQGQQQARQRWPEIAKARRACMVSRDPLVLHELAQILSFDHPNDRLLEKSRLSSRIARHFRGRVDTRYPAGFHPLVADLLADPAITAFTYRGLGDWPLIRLACIEQIKRHGGFPETECEDFAIRLLTARTGGSLFDWDDGELVSLDPAPSWAAGCRFQSEGIRLEGVCIDDGGFGARPLISTELHGIRDVVQVLIAPDQGEHWVPYPGRVWYRWAGAAHVGVLSSLFTDLSAIFEKHALLPIAQPDDEGATHERD